MEKERRIKWKEREVYELLNVIKRRKLVQLFDRTNHKNIKIYESIASELIKKGISKTPCQLRSKFKSMKGEYYKLKSGKDRYKGQGRRDISQYLTLLEEILSEKPVPESSTDEENGQYGDNGANEDSVNLNYTETENSIDINNYEEQEICYPIDISEIPSQEESKKRTYEDVIAIFLNGWKNTQKDMIKSIKEQDEVFFKYMNEQRKFEEELLRKDREETAKLFKSFMEAMTKKSSQYSTFLPISNVSTFPSSSTSGL